MIGTMDRAAVLIGVNRTGGLPVLRDAANSARRMERWAKDQGIEHVKVFTDEGGATVDVSEIKRAIKDIADVGTVEQLIVFFAGHGINISRGERWLLTDAPTDAQAAINVSGSAEAARWGRIPYVVMFSDACRTAAQSVVAQAIGGSEIFPNEDVAEGELPVDLFYACRLGRPAHEIADSGITAKEYRALYTRALVTALQGSDTAVLDAQGFVRPRPLKEFLKTELARSLRERNLQTKLIQVPDAHIASDPTAWISRIAEPPPRGEGPAPLAQAELGPTVGTVLDGLLEPILSDRLDDFADQLHQTSASDEPQIADLGASVDATASPFGPTHFETACGVKVRGARVIEAVGGPVQTEQLTDELVRIYPHEPGTTVLLVLDSGLGLALPAIPDFLAAVTVEGAEVVDVAYEPSEGTSRWHEFNPREREVRGLRAVAASSSREGTFELEGEDALEVARRMQYAKGIDPSLAIYAAYAYADHGRRDLIRKMYGFMLEDLGAVLFDVAMLARAETDHTLGFAPQLGQGWALLPASRIALPPSLEDLERHVLPGSLWTVYDPAGVERIREALLREEVQ
jgi:hypothetical protein